MKKIIFVSILFYNCVLSAQLNYPNAKQYLKEFLAIQTLLAENRTYDLNNFLKKYGWSGVEDNDNFFVKLGSFTELKYDDIYPIIEIKNEVSNSYHENYLVVYFFRFSNKENDVYFTRQETSYLKSLLTRLYERGLPYSLISSFEDLSKENKDITKIDRYTYKVPSQKSPDGYEIYKCSNFMNLSNTGLPNSDFFWGPGNILGIELIYPKLAEMERVRETNTTYEYSNYMTLKSMKREKGTPYVDFNVDFFMALKDFNDRIWSDR
jgi:hypothetical protein